VGDDKAAEYCEDMCDVNILHLFLGLRRSDMTIGLQIS